MANLRALKFIGAYTLLGFLPVGVNFLIVPLYTSKLPPAEFGVLAIANIVQAFTMLAITVGVDAAVGRFFFDYPDDSPDQFRLMSTALLCVALLTGVVAVLFATLGPLLFRIALPALAFGKFAPWILASAFAQVVQTMFFVWYRNREQLRPAMTLSIATTFAATSGTCVALLFVRPDAVGAMAGRTTGFALAVLPFLLASWRKLPFVLDRELAKRMFAFGVPLVGYTLVSYVLFNGDRLLLQRWFPLTTVGIYSLAVTLCGVLEIFLQATQQAVQPMLYRQLEARDPRAPERIATIYTALITFNLAVMVVLAVGAEPVLKVLGGAKYAGVSHFMALLCFAQLFRIRFLGFSLPLFHAKATRPLATTTALSLIPGVCVATIAARYLGPLGIAVGVLAWKATQASLARRAMRSGALVVVDMSRANPWLTVGGLWVLVFYAVRMLSPRAVVVSWATGFVLMVAALLGTWRTGREFLQVRSVPKGSPAEA